MVKYLYDNNIVIYTYAALGGLGLLLRLIVNIVYKHLVKESDRMSDTKNKMLLHMKMKFSTCYKLKIGVNNVDTFVDKNVLRYRFCGVLLSTWDNLCGLVLFLNLLIVPILAVFGAFYNCGQDQILLSGAVGLSTCGVLIIVDKSMNLLGKKKMLRLNLLDYLENFCKVRLEQEAVNPELLEQYRKEYFQTVEGKTGTAATKEGDKTDAKDELNRRREARRIKEEEKKQQAAMREEEHKRAEEARKEEERRKLEERKQLAAKRREEERLRLEQEKAALEARRAQQKKKVEDKQTGELLKTNIEQEKEHILQSMEEDFKHSGEKVGMEAIIKGVEEIAAEKEQAVLERTEKIESENQEAAAERKKGSTKTSKNSGVSPKEEKLIEDVLKEFFA